jgi:hypothetical protein
MNKSDYIEIEDVASEERIRPDSAMPEDNVGPGDDFGANGGTNQQRAKGDGDRAQGERTNYAGGEQRLYAFRSAPSIRSRSQRSQIIG